MYNFVQKNRFVKNTVDEDNEGIMYNVIFNLVKIIYPFFGVHSFAIIGFFLPLILLTLGFIYAPNVTFMMMIVMMIVKIVKIVKVLSADFYYFFKKLAAK
jgi:hypothetical protein